MNEQQQTVAEEQKPKADPMNDIARAIDGGVKCAGAIVGGTVGTLVRIPFKLAEGIVTGLWTEITK